MVQLIQVGAGDDSLLHQAYSHIGKNNYCYFYDSGDYYADRQRWDKAYTFYSKAKNMKVVSLVGIFVILVTKFMLLRLGRLRDIGKNFAAIT